MDEKKMDDILCGVINIHEEIINKVKEKMPKEETLYDLAELFKVFGDSTRIRILYVLFVDEMCVCDIAYLLGMSQSAISHQLRVLRNARLVKSRRSGKEMYYSLNDEHISMIFDSGLAHVEEKQS